MGNLGEGRERKLKEGGLVFKDLERVEEGGESALAKGKDPVNIVWEERREREDSNRTHEYMHTNIITVEGPEQEIGQKGKERTSTGHVACGSELSRQFNGMWRVVGKLSFGCKSCNQCFPPRLRLHFDRRFSMPFKYAVSLGSKSFLISASNGKLYKSIVCKFQ